MRVLFTSVSGLGNVYPMVPLARAFKDRGHEVHWVIGVEALPRLREAGIPVVGGGLPSMHSRLDEHRRRFPEVLDLPPAAIPDHTFPSCSGRSGSARTRCAACRSPSPGWRRRTPATWPW